MPISAPPGSGWGYFLAQREGYYRAGAWVMAGGLACHTLALIQRAWAAGALPAATFGEALLLFAWALVAAFLVLIWRYPIKILGALVAPLAALMVSGALILPARPGRRLSPAPRASGSPCTSPDPDWAMPPWPWPAWGVSST